ncbi:MAG: lamin tail domain-containing protein [Bacteroidetes bacterium]|nr:lamin tail domain-containing protein [Bacteroidota bacterium]
MFKKLLVFLASIISLFTSYSQCDNIFFSEYVEGSSNNRAIELYNPTPNPINLAGYRITMKGFNNAGTANSVFFNLNGTIASKATYVLANDQADLNNIRAIADTIIPGGGGSIMNYTGDDALILSKSGITIDAIGTRNAVDRSQVDSPMLKDHTLIRKPNTDKGDTSDWLTSAKNSWEIKNNNFFSDLKNHSSNVCGSTIDTTVRFGSITRTVDENVGLITVPIRLNIANPTATMTVNVVLSMGDPADVNNFTTYTSTFLPNATTDTLKFTVTDDAIAEYKDVLKFSLRSPSTNLVLNRDSVFTLTINPSDNPPVTMTISAVRGNNTNGIPDSFGKYPVILKGIVLGTEQDASPTGIRFTLYDQSTGTNGIQVNSPANNWGNYVVKEGDSVLVQGKSIILMV